MPGPVGAHDAWHADQAVRAEALRVKKFIVDAAIDHVHLLEAGGGAHEDAVVLDHQVAALDHFHPHLIGQEAVLVIGAVETAGGEDDDGRIGPRGLGRDRFQRCQQMLRVAVYGRQTMPRAKAWEQPQHRLAVLQHVADARGRAAIILQHEEIVRPRAYHVDAADMGVDAAGRGEVHHLLPERLILQDQAGRDDAGLQDALPVIDIGQEGVERPHPLLQPGRERAPFGGGDDPRNDVEGDEALRVAALAIHREGDAQAAEQQFGLGGFFLQGGQWGAFDPLGDLGIGGAGELAVAHFVERHGQGCTP